MREIDSFRMEIIQKVLDQEFIDKGWVFMRNLNEPVLNFSGDSHINLRFAQVSAEQLNIEMHITTKYGQMWNPVMFLHVDMGAIVMTEYMNEAIEYLQEFGDKLTTKTTSLSMKESAIIAAFSIQAVEVAQMMRDQKFISNGLLMNMIINSEGNPQVLLDDKYGEDFGIIGVFNFNDEGLNMQPSVQYKKLFDDFGKNRLLTSWNVE